MKCRTTSVAVKVEEEVEKQEVQHNTSTKMSTDKNIPKYLVENKGWTEQEAKKFVDEIERLKNHWYLKESKKPDITTGETLASIREAYERANGFARIQQENEERRVENDRRKQQRLKRIELENMNLQWPKSKPFTELKTSFDYWKNGCLYCEYEPGSTNDYQCHIVVSHPGKPAYTGPADIEKYGLSL